MSVEQLEKGIGPVVDEDEDEDTEWEPVSLSVVDGECIILDRDRLIDELDGPMLVTMHGQQLWLWWYRDGEWVYSEIKGRPKETPPKRKEPKDDTVTPLRKRRDTTQNV